MQLLHRQLESGSKSLVVAEIVFWVAQPKLLVVAAIVRLATLSGFLVFSDGWLVGAVGVPVGVLVGVPVGSNSGKSVGISDG